MTRKFLRSDTMRHIRLGKKSRKLQKWRRPRGRHSKIRRHRFGYPRMPSPGYGAPRAATGKIKIIPIIVHNEKELAALNSKNIAIIARIGAKKKIALIKKARENNISLANVRGAA